MKRALAIADRAAPVALKLITALNVLFLAAFVATLLVMAGQVDAGSVDTNPVALNGFAAIHP
jgi:hypothetical protein